MSLLLDALRRAEQEKQHSRGAATNREPVIAPMAANAPSASAMELQPLGGGTPASHASAGRSEAAAHAAQAVFQAKQPLPENAKGRSMVWATICIVIIVLAGAGAYVWNQLRLIAPPARPVAFNPLRPPPAPTAEPASLAPHFEPLAEQPTSAALPPAVPKAPAPRSANEALVAQLLQERAAAPAAAPPPVRLARSPEPPRLPADLSSGYQALREGDLAAARRHYQAALAADGRNLDALLGMATVEARGGNRPAAVGQYRRALELDPRNATALAALAALSDANAPESLEPQLLRDIARTPRNGALHLALGNLFAGQGRWNDAQAAYFEAHRLEPASPEVMHNLAVALDQLGKGRLAATFYRRALEAASGQAPQFDTAADARRAAELEAGEAR